MSKNYKEFREEMRVVKERVLLTIKKYVDGIRRTTTEYEEFLKDEHPDYTKEYDVGGTRVLHCVYWNKIKSLMPGLKVANNFADSLEEATTYIEHEFHDLSFHLDEMQETFAKSIKSVGNELADVEELLTDNTQPDECTN